MKLRSRKVRVPTEAKLALRASSGFRIPKIVFLYFRDEMVGTCRVKIQKGDFWASDVEVKRGSRLHTLLKAAKKEAERKGLKKLGYKFWFHACFMRKYADKSILRLTKIDLWPGETKKGKI